MAQFVDLDGKACDYAKWSSIYHSSQRNIKYEEFEYDGKQYVAWTRYKGLGDKIYQTSLERIGTAAEKAADVNDGYLEYYDKTTKGDATTNHNAKVADVKTGKVIKG